MAQFPADPKRDAAAKLLAESGHSWARVTLREARGAFKAGSKFFGIPSSKNDGTAYYTNLKVCTCPDYQQRGAICKHMRAVNIYSAVLRAKREQSGSAEEADPTQPMTDEQFDAEIERVLGPAPTTRYEAIYPACKGGCGDVSDYRDGYCYPCGSDREWEARRDNQRATVGV